jgi:uncharacterized protein CbrC (UPF0167 family)
MSETLPFFKYHPNPIETGNLKLSDKICACCEKARGYIYIASVYSTYDLDESICPWCIADGSAAEKFNATFSDAHPLWKSGIPEEVIQEVVKKTPGFITWQQEVWLSHCNDACEFHGDLAKQEAKYLEDEAIKKFCIENDLDEEDGREIVQYYEKGGDLAIYKFVCRHCGEIKLYTDCS